MAIAALLDESKTRANSNASITDPEGVEPLREAIAELAERLEKLDEAR